MTLVRDADLDAGVTDLSIVAVAGRVATGRICTFDDHFRVLRPPSGPGAFTIVPERPPGRGIP